MRTTTPRLLSLIALAACAPEPDPVGPVRIHVEATPIVASAEPATPPPLPASQPKVLPHDLRAAELVASLAHVWPQHEKSETAEIFRKLQKLEDPGGADALASYIATDPKPHWKTEAAMRLAELGDLRALPTLAWRIAEDPLQHEDEDQRRDDSERVAAARLLADLAVLYPDKLNEIRQGAELAVILWLKDRPQPHANAMRFLAASHARTAVPLLQAWAGPPDLPKPGAQMFPDEWATAQPALRYLGQMKAPATWALLERQLHRRPKGMDVSMDSLMQGGLAVLGMALRDVGVGASDGFAEWGDPRAYPILTKYIEDPLENEQSRLEACFDLAWVATDVQMNDVAARVQTWNKPDPKSATVRKCYLETLARHPAMRATWALWDLLASPSVDEQTHHAVARVFGFGPLGTVPAQKLHEMLKDSLTRDDAALALLMGGGSGDAVAAMLAYPDPYGSMANLKRLYDQSWGYWSDRDYDDGHMVRWAQNAEACRSVMVGDRTQEWVSDALSLAMGAIGYDNGPHSLTRVQLRKRLMTDAMALSPEKREGAVLLLRYLKEEGVLMAVADVTKGTAHAP
jgi:hypothetical protein